MPHEKAEGLSPSITASRNSDMNYTTTERKCGNPIMNCVGICYFFRPKKSRGKMLNLRQFYKAYIIEALV